MICSVKFFDPATMVPGRRPQPARARRLPPARRRASRRVKRLPCGVKKQIPHFVRDDSIGGLRGGQGVSFCSAKPSSKSTPMARSAAGIAPARMTLLLTMATPRKMNTPSPPAPMAAAIVATPMAMTAATRTPARITPMESGSCTFQRIWRGVMPMARAASSTGGFTPAMPV